MKKLSDLMSLKLKGKKQIGRVTFSVNETENSDNSHLILTYCKYEQKFLKIKRGGYSVPHNNNNVEITDKCYEYFKNKSFADENVSRDKMFADENVSRDKMFVYNDFFITVDRFFNCDENRDEFFKRDALGSVEIIEDRVNTICAYNPNVSYVWRT